MKVEVWSPRKNLKVHVAVEEMWPRYLEICLIVSENIETDGDLRCECERMKDDWGRSKGWEGVRI